MHEQFLIISRHGLVVAGDVGGSLGLFIGASLLTVIEIMELLMMQTPLLTYCVKSKLFHRNGKI